MAATSFGPFQGANFNQRATAAAAAAHGHLNVAYTRVLIQGGGATGDISHVVAALANTQDMAVLVVDGTTNQLGQQVQTNGLARIANIYVDQFGIPDDRVVHIDLQGDVGANVRRMSGRLGAKQGRSTFTVTFATKVFRRNFTQAKMDRAAQALRGQTFDAGENAGRSETDEYLEGFLTNAGVSHEVNTVILWGRRSGATTGQHPEQDHSRVAMRELCEYCVGRQYQVLIAGQFVDDDNLVHNQYLTQNARVLGEFYIGDEILGNRYNQVRLFHILRQNLRLNRRGMVHIGMRSGGLDMYGFAGQPTVYLWSVNPEGHRDRDVRMTNMVNDVRAADDVTQSYDRFQTANPLRPAGEGDVRGHVGFDAARFQDELVPKIEAMLAIA